MFRDLEDQMLITQLKEDNHEAFAQIIAKYQRFIYISAYECRRNEDDAKDISQNVQKKLWEKRHTLEVNISLRAYLGTMVRNHCIDMHRKDQRESESREGYQQQRNAIEPPHETNDLLEIIATWLKNKKGKGYRTLEDLLLRNMRPSEIARKYQVEMSTVRTHIYGSRKALIKMLKENHYDLLIKFGPEFRL
jgi:RNA polymerase sigma factor (sigma-70 family)